MQLKNRMLVMTNYTKIVTKTYNSILLEFNCVTQFDTRCPDWHKVTVTFVARSDDVKLIYALSTRWIKFASRAQLTFEPLYDKAIIAKKRSDLVLMFSYEKNGILATTTFTKIFTETYISILWKSNCVTAQFVTRCIYWDKVSVKFVARSDDILWCASQFG